MIQSIEDLRQSSVNRRFMAAVKATDIIAVERDRIPEMDLLSIWKKIKNQNVLFLNPSNSIGIVSSGPNEYFWYIDNYGDGCVIYIDDQINP